MIGGAGMASVAIAVAAGLAAPVHAVPGGAEVLAEFNRARTDPAAYGQTIQRYRDRFAGRIARGAAGDADEVTEEGTAAVDEALAALATQSPRPAIADAALLARAAADLARAQAADGSTGHVAADGTDPGSRARRHGGDDQVWEMIAYGPDHAGDVVRQLIVDDGVAGRWHRKLLFESRLRYAGVACGPHPGFRTVCVIDLAETPTASALNAPPRVASGR